MYLVIRRDPRVWGSWATMNILVVHYGFCNCPFFNPFLNRKWPTCEVEQKIFRFGFGLWSCGLLPSRWAPAPCRHQGPCTDPASPAGHGGATWPASTSTLTSPMARTPSLKEKHPQGAAWFLWRGRTDGEWCTVWQGKARVSRLQPSFQRAGVTRYLQGCDFRLLWCSTDNSILNPRRAGVLRHALFCGLYLLFGEMTSPVLCRWDSRS